MSSAVAGRGLLRTSLATGTSCGPSPLVALGASLRSSSSIASQRRLIHSSEKRTSTMTEMPGSLAPPVPAPNRAPLSVLPLSMIVRSLGTTTVACTPMLLAPSLRVMDFLASTESAFFNADRNPILRFLIKQTFYVQFCAGENNAEVNASIDRLKAIGFTGVLLGYAKEVVLPEAQAQALANGAHFAETPEAIRDEIEPWAEGVRETIRLGQPGDFIGLKFTGAGAVALYQLSKRIPCADHMYKAIDSICQLASERGIRLLFDAEQDALQDGIDDWTIQFAQKYNKDPNNAVIFGTYQAYKKCTPRVLRDHLDLARKLDFTLGVKLVRGAYLNSDPRECFHETKELTDACYDGVAASVLTRQWNSTLKGEGEFPSASLVLATHNRESVQRARAICDAGAARSPVAFGQLMGMADDISCELVEASNERKKMAAAALPTGAAVAPALPTFKYMVWGSTGECMKYLLRRAYENKDAVSRTRDSRDALWSELVRRCKSVFKLA